VGTDLDEALVQTAPAPASPRIDQTLTSPTARPALPAIEPGMRLGHFQLTKRLGAGGMGEVYLATDLALDRPVAIKLLPADTAAARDRMVREARAQARVMHKNVAHIYFIGEDSGRLYFAMEYVTGETLADRCVRGPLAAEDALALIHDAVLGLREAQRSGFTHRDVKPSNLMVDGHGVVKVLDFGLVAGTPEHAETGGPIAQTTLAGTPLYMAPEQARGEPVDFRADIYALGATLFQLVSGRPPFEAQSAAELRSLHESANRPALPRGIVPRTQSTALDRLIAKMMAPRAENRHASYDELLRAIELLSTQYTRPAGFWVRSAALGVDLLLASVAVGLAHGLLFPGTFLWDGYYLAFAAVLQLLLLGRWGTTIGGALFELETMSVATAAKVSWRTAFARTLVMYGPLIAAYYAVTMVVNAGVIHPVAFVLRLLNFALFAWYPLRLAYDALRMPGKRTPWDRWSGTMVRYRTSRVTAAAG
jgi:hypothetical protein